VKIRSWYSSSLNLLDETRFSSYDRVFTSSVKLDERTDYIHEIFHRHGVSLSYVRYDFDSASIIIDGRSFGVMNFDSFDFNLERVAIDVTSLSFPEILHLLRIFNFRAKSFDLIYIQPSEYSQDESIKNFDRPYTSALSDDGVGLYQLPPYIGYSDNLVTFCFLGWEGHRLGAFLNSDEFYTPELNCLVGVPPFKFGWENKTFSNNYRYLAEYYRSGVLKFVYAGANDPIYTYNLIDIKYRSSRYERKNLCLIPFGTKPAAVSVAMFAINNPSVVLLYDFVEKKKHRTSGKDIVNVWKVAV